MHITLDNGTTIEAATEREAIKLLRKANRATRLDQDKRQALHNLAHKDGCYRYWQLLECNASERWLKAGRLHSWFGEMTGVDDHQREFIKPDALGLGMYGDTFHLYAKSRFLTLVVDSSGAVVAVKYAEETGEERWEMIGTATDGKLSVCSGFVVQLPAAVAALEAVPSAAD